MACADEVTGPWDGRGMYGCGPIRVYHTAMVNTIVDLLLLSLVPKFLSEHVQLFASDDF